MAGFALNLVLALQMLWYWNSPTSKKTASAKLNKPVSSKAGAKQVKEQNATTSGASYAKTAAKSPSTRRRG